MGIKKNKRAKRPGKTITQLTLAWELDDLKSNLAQVQGEPRLPAGIKRMRHAQKSEDGRKAKIARLNGADAFPDEESDTGSPAPRLTPQQKKQLKQAKKKAKAEEEEDLMGSDGDVSSDEDLDASDERSAGDSDSDREALKTVKKKQNKSNKAKTEAKKVEYNQNKIGEQPKKEVIVSKKSVEQPKELTFEQKKKELAKKLAEQPKGTKKSVLGAMLARYENAGSDDDEEDDEEFEFVEPDPEEMEIQRPDSDSLEDEEDEMEEEEEEEEEEEKVPKSKAKTAESSRLAKLLAQAEEEDSDDEDGFEMDEDLDDEEMEIDSDEEEEEVEEEEEEEEEKGGNGFGRGTKDKAKVAQRAERFEGSFNDPATLKVKVKSDGKVVGTSKAIEKEYLRLTSEPDPADVRPLANMKKAFDLVKKKWKEEHNYEWASSQLKSIRQDLTVQDIKDAFTVNVYEIHARIALERADMLEFGQCLLVLMGLYEQGVSGNDKEFYGYFILRAVMENTPREVVGLLKRLGPGMMQVPAIDHALSVAKAVQHQDYHTFFELYTSAPNMSAILIDQFVERMRERALAVITKAMQPTIPVAYIEQELAFPTRAECMAFLRQNNCKVEGENLRTK